MINHIKGYQMFEECLLFDGIMLDFVKYFNQAKENNKTLAKCTFSVIVYYNLRFLSKV